LRASVVNEGQPVNSETPGEQREEALYGKEYAKMDGGARYLQ
jgi:hypothetical protein